MVEKRNGLSKHSRMGALEGMCRDPPLLKFPPQRRSRSSKDPRSPGITHTWGNTRKRPSNPGISGRTHLTYLIEVRLARCFRIPNAPGTGALCTVCCVLCAVCDCASRACCQCGKGIHFITPIQSFHFCFCAYDLHTTYLSTVPCARRNETI